MAKLLYFVAVVAILLIWLYVAKRITKNKRK